MSGSRDNAMERTEQPTPRRLAEARQRGQVARSADLSGGGGLLAGGVLLGWLGPAMLDGLGGMTAGLLDGRSEPLAGPGDLARDVRESGASLLWPAAGVLAGLVVAAVAAGVLQVGGLVTAEPLRPRWSRVNPLEGLRRVFSWDSLVRGGMAGVKLATVVGLSYLLCRSSWRELLLGAVRDGSAVRLVVRLMLLVGSGLVVLGVADLLYRRWRRQRELMMTRSQWREEMRRSDGDPAVRSRQRRIAKGRVQDSLRNRKQTQPGAAELYGASDIQAVRRV